MRPAAVGQIAYSTDVFSCFLWHVQQTVQYLGQRSRSLATQSSDKIVCNLRMERYRKLLKMFHVTDAGIAIS